MAEANCRIELRPNGTRRATGIAATAVFGLALQGCALITFGPTVGVRHLTDSKQKGAEDKDGLHTFCTH